MSKSAKQLAGAPKAKAPSPPVPDQVLSDAHRAVLDPEVRKVHSAKLQVQEMQHKLDLMLELVFPDWVKGEHVYLPDTGGFYAKGTKFDANADPLGAPHSRKR